MCYLIRRYQSLPASLISVMFLTVLVDQDYRL